MSRPLAPHVQAAMAATGHRPVTQRAAVQPAGLARHVQRGIRFEGYQAPPGSGAPRGGGDEFVLYDEKKLGGAPPPPPKRGVFVLGCGEKGSGCSMTSMETGRSAPAGEVYAGFVRMKKGGPIYVSPRPGPGLQGDSHPTIASRTPEWLKGQRAVVAAGEVGILGGAIVGHNDKTGHFQSRHNRQQAGMPLEKFHPFTQDPKDWYKE